jgi:hypothetical protein
MDFEHFKILKDINKKTNTQILNGEINGDVQTEPDYDNIFCKKCKKQLFLPILYCVKCFNANKIYKKCNYTLYKKDNKPYNSNYDTATDFIKKDNTNKYYDKYHNDRKKNDTNKYNNDIKKNDTNKYNNDREKYNTVKYYDKYQNDLNMDYVKSGYNDKYYIKTYNN